MSPPGMKTENGWWWMTFEGRDENCGMKCDDSSTSHREFRGKTLRGRDCLMPWRMWQSSTAQTLHFHRQLVAIKREHSTETAEENCECGRTAQVAIAWCIAKGTTPIPGVRNVRQAQADHVFLPCVEKPCFLLKRILQTLKFIWCRNRNRQLKFPHF